MRTPFSNSFRLITSFFLGFHQQMLISLSHCRVLLWTLACQTAGTTSPMMVEKWKHPGRTRWNQHPDEQRANVLEWQNVNNGFFSSQPVIDMIAYRWMEEKAVNRPSVQTTRRLILATLGPFDGATTEWCFQIGSSQRALEEHKGPRPTAACWQKWLGFWRDSRKTDKVPLS